LTSLMPSSLMFSTSEACQPYYSPVGAAGFFAAVFDGTPLAAAGFEAAAVFAGVGF